MPRSWSDGLVTSAAGAALLLATVAAPAQCFLPRLVHGDAQNADHLGLSLSLGERPAGVYLAAGMPYDNTGAGANAGSVRFFTRGGGFGIWAETPAMTLTAPDGAGNDLFGDSVWLRDPSLAVGATGVGGAGAVYLFRRNASDTFIQEAKLVPSGTGLGDELGASVAVYGDWAIAGAPGRDWDLSPNSGVSDPDAGVAYLFRRQSNATWTTTELLAAPTGGALNAGLAAGARAGAAVAMWAGVAVVGVPMGERINWPADHGYIRVFRHSPSTDTWSNDTDLSYYTGAQVQSGDHYGAAVSVDSTTIAVGAPDDDATAAEVPAGATAKQNSGCVYFVRYTVDGWVADGRVIPPDASDNARFGASVSVRSGRCLITAPGARRAYIYERQPGGGWALTATIADPGAATGFGSAGAFDGTYAAIGDDDESDGGIAARGAVYLYTPSAVFADSCAGAPPIGTGTTTACTTYAQADGAAPCGNGAGGSGPDIYFSYTPSCGGTVTFDTAGSGFDTVLSVHGGCPDGAETYALACNDDFGGALTSRISMTVAADTRYLIRVAGFNGASGSVTLNVSHPQPSNDDCSSPIAVIPGASYFFRTCGATTDGPTAVGGPSPCLDHTDRDVWYSFVSPVAGTLRLNTCGSNFDTLLSVFPGATCPGGAIGEIACNDDAAQPQYCPDHPGVSLLSVGTLPSLPYLIRVGGFDLISPTGDGVLTVHFSPACPCDWNQSAQLSVQDIFDFLSSYFAGGGDFNQSGATTVQDIFDFLACYFAGCA